jgi:signal transduction histidine kinase
VEHVESHKLLEAKSAVPVQMQPQMDIKPIETIVEGEAIAISLIQKLNHIMASDDLDKMTEFKLNRICGSLTSIRKLLTRMSHMEDSAEDNEKTLNLEYLPLKEHLEQIMRLILSEYKELEIESRVICDKDLIVYTDPLIISQIITHLATNAIKHGFDIQTKGCLTIEVIYDVDYLRVYFSDNGKGMSQSIQERIFEPFYTTSGMQGDVGLGLAEVYGLVNDVLGGAINCSSRIGFGTDFFIDIPGIGPGLWFEEPGRTEQSS